MQWWLLERNMAYQVGKVQEALADLMKNKLIVETRASGESVSYRLNRDQAR